MLSSISVLLATDALAAVSKRLTSMSLPRLRSDTGTTLLIGLLVRSPRQVKMYTLSLDGI